MLQIGFAHGTSRLSVSVVEQLSDAHILKPRRKHTTRPWSTSIRRSPSTSMTTRSASTESRAPLALWTRCDSSIFDHPPLLTVFTRCIPIQIRASIANGIKVPSEFEDKSVVDVIVSATCPPRVALSLTLTVISLQEQAVVSEWFSGCERSSNSNRSTLRPQLKFHSLFLFHR